MPRTTVFGVYDGGTYRRARAGQRPSAGAAGASSRASGSGGSSPSACVLAAGAIERPIVFGGNDRPGVMLAGAVRTYLNRYARRAGRARRGLHQQRRRLAHGRATSLRAGVAVAASSMPRPTVAPRCSRPREGRRAASSPARVVTRRVGGDARARQSTSRDAAGDASRIDCDLLAMSGGWNPTSISPAIAAASRSGTTTLAAFVPGATAAGHDAWPARPPARFGLARLPGGRARGRRGTRRPATRACSAIGRSRRRRRRRERCAIAPLWRVAGVKGKAFVDFQNDVTAKDIALAAARRLPLGRASQALHHARHGDRPGQDLQRQRPRHHGRADAAARSPQTGTTTFRPPYTPVAIGALAGHHRGKDFQPDAADAVARLGRGAGRGLRRDRPVAARAVVSAGRRDDWLRRVNREVKAVRAGVGICDVSTLGKIDVQGPDAGDVPRPPLHQHASRRCRSARRATA